MVISETFTFVKAWALPVKLDNNLGFKAAEQISGHFCLRGALSELLFLNFLIRTSKGKSFVIRVLFRKLNRYLRVFGCKLIFKLCILDPPFFFHFVIKDFFKFWRFFVNFYR